MRHTLEADSIQLEFSLRSILSDVYIKCETGKITGLLGRNGEGKTCLMRIIYGNLEATSKSIRFDNRSIYHAFKRPDLLVYLPQVNFIPKSLTLKRIFRDFHLEFGDFGKDFPEFQSKYRSTLRNLSGGERRLVEVYVILKSKSQFVMLDEPFSHFTPLYIEKISEILVKEKENKGLLVTDHIYRPVVNIADNLYVLKDGKTYLTKSVNDIEALGYARL